MRLTEAMKRDTDDFQLGRLLQALGSMGGADSDVPEFRDSLPELRAAGRVIDGRTAIVPWEVLTRDLVSGTPSAGGYTAGAVRIEHTPTLRGFSVLADAGARVVHLPAGALGITRFSTALTAAWLANEGDAVTESDPVIARADGSPKMLATPPVDVSRAVLKQSRVIESAVRGEIMSAIGRALDAAALNGSGASGQPTGALATSGTVSQSGTTLAHTGLVAMLRQVLAAGSPRSRVRWLCDPLAFATLAGRERAGGSSSGFIVDGFTACGLPVDVAGGMPNNSLLCLDPSEIVLLLWGGGVEIRVDPFTASTAGAVRFVAHVGADVVIPAPGRIAKATSIT